MGAALELSADIGKNRGITDGRNKGCDMKKG
jgi:hypothetical protein